MRRRHYFQQLTLLAIIGGAAYAIANKATSTENAAANVATADVEITRQIRSSLVRDNDLSLYAKNVSIITSNGIVTLSGVVNSDKEKAIVENHALDFIASPQLHDQLKVAPSENAR